MKLGKLLRCLYSLDCLEGEFSEGGLPVFSFLGNRASESQSFSEIRLPAYRVLGNSGGIKEPGFNSPGSLST
jgi:hypothetical protein